MAQATWEFEEEFLPGQSTVYNDEDISYDQDKVDGLNVYYDNIGEITTWSLEDK